MKIPFQEKVLSLSLMFLQLVSTRGNSLRQTFEAPLVTILGSGVCLGISARR